MPAQKSISFKDNLYAVKYFISGQGLSLAVFKATRSDLIGPKTKHVDYNNNHTDLTTITHEPNVSIPKLIKYLSCRAHQPEWTVVFKSLIVIHHILNRGNQRFIQNLASSAGNDKLFAQINSFNDVSSKLASDMSTYLRRYARYLDSRIKTYRVLGMDFCRLKSDRLPRKMKDIEYHELMLTIPSLQNQFDLVLKFDITMAELDNGIIDQAFLMLYGDLVKLYIVYQTAIIRVIEFFMSTRYLNQARELFNVYSLFLIRMDMVQDFMTVVESTGMKTDDFPRVSRVPNIELSAFKERLKQLESKQSPALQLNLPSISHNHSKLHNNDTHINDTQQNNRPSTSSKTPLPILRYHELDKSSTSCKNRVISLNSDNLFKPMPNNRPRRNRGSFGETNNVVPHTQSFSNNVDVSIRYDNPASLMKKEAINFVDSEPGNDKQQQQQDLLFGRTSQYKQDLAKQNSPLENVSIKSGTSLKPPPKDLFSNNDNDENKHIDFDLMVIDSDTTSSDTSMMADASPYTQLDEKDLIEQVFPPIPQGLTSSRDDNRTLNANTDSNTNGGRGAAAISPEPKANSSDWVHIQL